MDGGGRLVGSVSGAGGLLLTGDLGGPLRFPSLGLFQRERRSKAERHRERARRVKPRDRVLSQSWVGMLLSAAIVGGVGLYAANLGGEYTTFVAQHGAPLDIAAKIFGFEIDTVRISGLQELTQDEIMSGAGLSDRNSLLFLDAAGMRDRLKSMPLVRDVAVRKLFPNSLSVDVTERGAAAIWQKDGQLSVVAGDGVAIDDVHDDRFNQLPFVVGPGANAHLGEFTALLDSAGDLRDRIKAGIYVGQRRWTLQMDTGVEVMLPEIDPKTALARLAALDHAGRITDKDVLWLDLRIPGRITARLSEDAAAARLAMLAKKPKKSSKE